MQQIQFEYFRGMEAEQYSFYRVPKVLFTESCFKSLSCEAKVLYGLMLDRMGLSIKNRWLDEQDRVYIIFTVEEIMELLGCGRQKAVRSIAELDTEKGIGLIEKRRLGLGRPNVIYVKNIRFMEATEPDGWEKEPESRINPQKYENHTSRSVKNELQEVPKSNFCKDENQTSGSMKSELQEVRKSYCSNTDYNKTEYSETDISKTDINKTDVKETGDLPSILSGETKGLLRDEIDGIGIYRQVIRENVGYANFRETGYDGEILNELVELMAEVMVMPDSAPVRIAGLDRPAAAVKSRLMKLEHAHMEYVLLCLRQNTTKVGNIRAYLLTALYNAPATISNYYQAEANHDLYGGDCAWKT